MKAELARDNITPHQTVKRAAIGARNKIVAIDPQILSWPENWLPRPMLATSTARPVEVATG